MVFMGLMGARFESDGGRLQNLCLNLANPALKFADPDVNPSTPSLKLAEPFLKFADPSLNPGDVV